MTAGLRPDDTAIDRLRIKAIRNETERIRRDLTLASWPRATGRSWVIIRQVAVNTSRGRVAESVTHETRKMVGTAQPPGSGRQVIRFDNLTDLLAHLVADLAEGRAVQQWYWRRWAHLFSLAPGRAIANLLAEQIRHLPAVTSRLAGSNKLGRVWRQLSHADAVQLIKELAWSGRYTLPSNLSNAIDTEPEIGLVPLPATIHHRWTGILLSMTADDPRRQLAFLLIGQEVAPLFLIHAPARLLKNLSYALFGQDKTRPQETVSVVDDSPGETHSMPGNAVRRDGDISAESSTGTLPSDMVEKTTDPSKPPADLSGSTPLASKRVESDRKADEPRPRMAEPWSRLTERAAKTIDSPTQVDQKGEYRQTERPNETATPRTITSDNPGMAVEMLTHESASARTESAAKHPVNALHTRQGGLFYLLNILNRHPVQALINSDHRAADLISGWGWLYRLGQELDLDETDPVVLFMALQMGLESVNDLKDLPPLPLREEVLNLTEAWYGRNGLWQPDLLNLKAIVLHTASHIDLYASLDSVRLPVRLAGLDINPGWLPWLGRVVLFHYES